MWTPERGSTEPADAQGPRRGIALIGVVLAGLLVWLLVALTEGGTDNQPVASETPATPSALDVCVDDTTQFLNDYAQAVNRGDDSFIYRRYGSEDPRTHALIQIFAQFQTDVFQYGQDRASQRSLERVVDYCTQQ